MNIKALSPFSGSNAGKYSVAAVKPDENSPLKGKTVIFLGSSVTFGAAAHGESFADFLAKKDGIISVKEAVSGTTLVDGKDSYIPRMKKISPDIKADAFVCQLSTNDATLKKPVGEISPSFDAAGFDTSTVAGAVEYIISYAKKTWNCPVLFYTGTKYDSKEYAFLVRMLTQIGEKHGIGIIDLWNSDINAIPEKKYKFYMADPIHPTRAGYLEWWLPEFEKALSSVFTTGKE